jgi:putative effector of murein hydrolase LrgA (UPF0299 family)
MQRGLLVKRLKMLWFGKAVQNALDLAIHIAADGLLLLFKHLQLFLHSVEVIELGFGCKLVCRVEKPSAFLNDTKS